MNAKMTYAQLNALVDRFAAALQQLGIKKGDRVGVYIANCPQFIIGYYGALRVGAIVAPFIAVFRWLRYSTRSV